VEKRRKEKKPVSEPPVSMTGQLHFRDMYFAAQAALGWSFGQTYNNSHCRFIPWHLPSKVDTKSKLVTGGYEVDDPAKEIEFQRWAHGKTGFPWIDAIMRQLRTEGWIHHLARHSVACFLTRGGCYISWERGAEVFEELLVDHEAACNIGNWQWLSCTAFFAQFYRCYSPVAFGKKWDPEGNYIRKYVPELADMPKKYIYEPHKAPIADQKKAGVRIDGDGSQQDKDGLKLYPKPMFDFNTQRDICLEGMKNAYHVGLYGNDPKVMDGSWKKLFDDAGEGPTFGDMGGPGGLDTWDDADGADGDGHAEAPTPKKARKDAQSNGKASPRATRGHKREASQGTLDGAFKKKAK
jgi:cryptochrome